MAKTGPVSVLGPISGGTGRQAGLWSAERALGEVGSIFSRVSGPGSSLGRAGGWGRTDGGTDRFWVSPQTSQEPPVTSPWPTSDFCCRSAGRFCESSGSPLHERWVPPQAPAASEHLRGHRAAPRGASRVVSALRDTSCSAGAGAGGCVAQAPVFQGGSSGRDPVCVSGVFAHPGFSPPSLSSCFLPPAFWTVS